MKVTPAETLAKHTKSDGDCVVWTGRRNAQGYGRCQNMKRSWLAHRLAWVVSKGSIPDGLFVCHRCDNPACVKVDHLFLGTNTDNMRDMRAKGRGVWRRGSSSPFAKLTESKAAEIREMYAGGSWTQTALAKRFGVNHSQVSRIVTRKAWVLPMPHKDSPTVKP